MDFDKYDIQEEKLLKYDPKEAITEYIITLKRIFDSFREGRFFFLLSAHEFFCADTTVPDILQLEDLF